MKFLNMNEIKKMSSPVRSKKTINGPPEINKRKQRRISIKPNLFEELYNAPSMLHTESKTEMAPNYILKDFSPWMKPLGRGNYGTVYPVYIPEFKDTPFALKVMDKHPPEKYELTEWIKLSQHCQDRKVVPLLSAWKNSEGVVNYLMRQCEMSLANFIDHLNDLDIDNKITEKDEVKLIQVLPDILEALSCLHDQHTYYRDIQPGNILFCNGEWKLSDFGVSIPSNANPEELFELVGDARYIAPEVKFTSYNYKSDVFALGRMFQLHILPLLTPSSPLINMKHLSNILQMTTDPNVDTRPSAKEALNYLI